MYQVQMHGKQSYIFIHSCNPSCALLVFMFFVVSVIHSQAMTSFLARAIN
jgi:hypothetical protein